jgi:OmpA-OmpF porin, OOP family
MSKRFMFLVGLGMVFSTVALNAQTDERPWSIGLNGGLNQYNGDRGQSWYSLQQNPYGFASISFSRYLSPHFDVSLSGARGHFSNTEAISSWSTPKDIASRSFKVQYNQINLVLRYNILKPEAIVRPYIFAGAGLMVFEKKYTLARQRVEGALPNGGIGATFRFNPIVSLRLEESISYLTTDAIDKTVQGATNDAMLSHTAGLIFDVGKLPDADADGVSDKKDICTGTPAGVEVDDRGCPLDRDKDGTADYIDDCPDQFGTIPLAGCPDTDMDGLADKEDRCPSDAGTNVNRGCPDTDKDGIVDLDDKCSGTLAKYKVDGTGCPLDTDGDKVFNEDDRCPALAGAIALAGCPDSDKDGVSDLDDRCPGKIGTLANRGCPEIAPEDLTRINVIASKIFFETAKATLKTESLAQLDALVTILNRYEGAILIIEGHCDSDGTDEYNQDLSQRRTEAVKAYLMSKGIMESRLVAIGYGESKPIADNKTAAGKAKNRRVELKTTYEYKVPEK